MFTIRNSGWDASVVPGALAWFDARSGIDSPSFMTVREDAGTTFCTGFTSRIGTVQFTQSTEANQPKLVVTGGLREILNDGSLFMTSTDATLMGQLSGEDQQFYTAASLRLDSTPPTWHHLFSALGSPANKLTSISASREVTHRTTDDGNVGAFRDLPDAIVPLSTWTTVEWWYNGAAFYARVGNGDWATPESLNLGTCTIDVNMALFALPSGVQLLECAFRDLVIVETPFDFSVGGSNPTVLGPNKWTDYVRDGLRRRAELSNA